MEKSSRRSVLAALTMLLVWGSPGTSTARTTTVPVPGAEVRVPRDGVTYVLFGARQCPQAPTLLSGHVYVTPGGLTGCWSSTTKPRALNGVEAETIGECAVCLYFQP